MVSRMEKYYKNNSEVKQRSQKNKELYHNIYDYAEYSNIEGIATIDKNNEVDITKIKNTIRNRENYKREKQYRQITKPKEELQEVSVSNDFVEKDQKSYDIRDILTKAKDNTNIDNSYRSLDNTNYNILKNLKLNNKNNKDFEDDELKELINTITSTSMLNQMNDKELGLNMFNLEETDEKLESSKSIQQLLEQAKKYEENKNVKNPEIDNSFYTSSLNFTKDDFEEAGEIVKTKKSKKIIKKILIFLGLLIVTAGIIVGVYYLIK